jgi:phage-related minor tail protein
MGEAGPEAIMPLARGADGRLGVQAQGGGRAVNGGDERHDAGRAGLSAQPEPDRRAGQPGAVARPANR